MKKIVTRMVIMILVIIMSVAVNPGIYDDKDNNNAFASTSNAYNIDKDKLPYSEDEIFEQLFNISNKVEIKLDIPKEELLKLNNDYYTYADRNHKSPIYRKADMYITITTAKDKYTYLINEVGVRLKGNTSRTDFYDLSRGMYKLVHFKVSFKETFDDELYYSSDAHVWGDDKEGKALRKARKKRTFATLEKLDMKWNRNYDTTYIKEYYAYETFRENGVIAPHTNVASMDVSTDHAGIYTIYEPIDDIFINKNVSEQDQGGDLYKCGWTNSAPDLTDINSIGVEDEEKGAFYKYDLKTNKKKSDNSSLKNLIIKLNAGNLTKESLSKLVDMDSFLKFAAVSYFTGNPDDMRNNYNNYYIYFLKSSSKAIFIPYDLDRCFGITCGWNPTSNAMTRVSPFSMRAEGKGSEQVNQLFKHTVCQGGLFISEYENALKKVATGKWLTVNNFNRIYNIVQKNYAANAKPDKSYEGIDNSKFKFDNTISGDLSSDNNNVSFKLFITSIMDTYKKEIAKINNYMAKPYYIRGDFTQWNALDKYAMAYDKSSGTYSYKLSNKKTMSFKINNGVDGNTGEWYGYAAIASKPSGIRVYTDNDGNIHIPAGTYNIFFNPKTEKISIKLVDVIKKKQTITGSNGYKKYAKSGKFKLNAKASGNAKLTYSSSKKSVATVSSKGVVTIKGYGITKIKVKAAATASYKEASKYITVKVLPKKQNIISCKSKKTKTFDVKWKKDSKIAGYQIVYSKDSKFKNHKSIKVVAGKKVTKRITGLKKGTKYYVKVRSYIRAGNKNYYGIYSNVAKVKVK